MDDHSHIRIRFSDGFAGFDFDGVDALDKRTVGTLLAREVESASMKMSQTKARIRELHEQIEAVKIESRYARELYEASEHFFDGYDIDNTRKKVFLRRDSSVECQDNTVFNSGKAKKRARSESDSELELGSDSDSDAAALGYTSRKKSKKVEKSGGSDSEANTFDAARTLRRTSSKAEKGEDSQSDADENKRKKAEEGEDSEWEADASDVGNKSTAKRPQSNWEVERHIRRQRAAMLRHGRKHLLDNLQHKDTRRKFAARNPHEANEDVMTLLDQVREVTQLRYREQVKEVCTEEMMRRLGDDEEVDEAVLTKIIAKIQSVIAAPPM